MPLPVADEQEALVPAPLFAVQVELPRAAAVVNALLQRLPKRPPQRSHLVVVQRVDRPQRVDARLEQRILDVDVADAGDPLLVEQEGLDRLC